MCTEHAGKKHTRIYSSFYFLFFFLFRFYAYLTHIAYTHEYTYMYIHTRRYNTTWILHFGSNVTLSSSIATPNDSRYKWKIPPLPSPPFIHSFRFFLSFLFFFFWLTRGWAQSAPEAGVILSLTTISTIFNAIESSILFSSVFIILKSVLHAIRYRTLASLLANFRENDRGICVLIAVQALG